MPSRADNASGSLPMCRSRTRDLFRGRCSRRRRVCRCGHVFRGRGGRLRRIPRTQGGQPRLGQRLADPAGRRSRQARFRSSPSWPRTSSSPRLSAMPPSCRARSRPRHSPSGTCGRQRPHPPASAQPRRRPRRQQRPAHRRAGPAAPRPPHPPPTTPTINPRRRRPCQRRLDMITAPTRCL